MINHKPNKAKLERSIISKRFIETGWAMLKYIPRLFIVPHINGLDFFSPVNVSYFISRIERLRPDTPRVWGTMKPEQMLHHLNLAVGGSLGFYDLPDESYFLSRTVFRVILVDWFNEQPKGLRLPLNFIIPPEAHFDFDFEKRHLIEIVTAAGATRSKYDWNPHPMFGSMSYKEWGKLLTMHIDYHLRQFGV